MDNSKPTALLLGRFNPWNKGHRAMFISMLKHATPGGLGKHLEPTSEAHQICIMVRDMGLDNFEEIKEAIKDDLDLEFYWRYDIIQVPNITNIFYGRTVGFDVDRISLPEELEPLDEAQETKAEKKLKISNFGTVDNN